MATTTFAPSTASPDISSPPLDSLQPVAASPQISRTSVPIQNSSIASPGPNTANFASKLLPSSSSPSPSHLRQRPTFPPNPSSRLSTASLSFTLSHRDSYVPQFPSSLSYTSVRDFAYPNLHPLHYGPQPGLDTPASSHRSSQYIDSGNGGWFSGNSFGFSGSSGHQRRLSDPSHSSFGADESSGGWSGHWGGRSDEDDEKPNQLPPLQFNDGPPWTEDPDLHSPVVISKKHRKHQSSAAHMQSSQGYARRPSKNAVSEFHGGDWRDEGSSFRGQLADNSDGEPGGEFHNHPGGRGYYTSGQDNGDFTSMDTDSQEYYSDDEEGVYSDDGEDFGDPNRLSNQYFITIASPAEEMHGKAVALFDFQKENENELGLVEGQVIWVSYRHGMGWLVAEDPKTRESGLVPEQYVRLLRDIQQPILVEGSGAEDEDEEGSEQQNSNSPPTTSYTNGMRPVVSTFSTSSQDVHPYQGPLHQPGEQAPPRTLSRSGQGGMGSQMSTPTVGGWEDRIEALERAREQALMEEERSGYKSRSSSVVGSTGDETPRVGHGGGWNAPRRASGGSEVERRDSQLGMLDESEEGYDLQHGVSGVSNKGKGKEQAEPLPSTSLSMSELHSIPVSMDTLNTSSDWPRDLGIDFQSNEPAFTALR